MGFMVRSGQIRHGGAGCGEVWFGEAWVSWSGLARQGVARLSLEWYGFLGAFRLGSVRSVGVVWGMV